MKVEITIDDFEQDKPNCGNCTYKGTLCVRRQKSHPNGLVKNSCTGNYDGIVYRCINYQGKFMHGDTQLRFDF